MDYDLLKPFNLEDALNGAELLSRDRETRAKEPLKLAAVCGPDGDYCVRDAAGNLYTARGSLLGMAPLAWVEDKPVYKGDVLYSKISPHYGKAAEYHDGWLVLNTGSITYRSQVAAFTWTKPKRKREGWINIFPSLIIDDAIAYSSAVYSTSEEADENASPTRIDCIKITWME